jgi:HJR/Mrr/RecB family endonuclease
MRAFRGLAKLWSSLTTPNTAPAPPRANRASIIASCIGNFRPGPFQPDNAIRDCLNAIAQNEGWLSSAPYYEYLYKWERRTDVAPEYRELAQDLKQSFRARNLQLEEENRVREEARLISLLETHKDLVDKFYQIAERKVSTLDDYGEENWSALPKELDTIEKKLQERKLSSVESWRLRLILEENFKRYHEKQKAIILQDVSELTGVEFETHIAKLLRNKGYAVQGTNATGDQGADLLAQKDGKKIVIQAKRYAGSVGNKAVQEVIGAMNYYGADEAWVVTNSTFTPHAKALAQKSNVRLFDRFDLKNDALFSS